MKLIRNKNIKLKSSFAFLNQIFKKIAAPAAIIWNQIIVKGILLALVGTLFTLVGILFTPVGGTITLVGILFTLAGIPFASVGILFITIWFQIITAGNPKISIYINNQ